MMTLFLTYELKVAVLIAVFYIFWRLLVANETWHRLNRIVLLSTAVASFVLPPESELPCEHDIAVPKKASPIMLKSKIFEIFFIITPLLF